MKITKSQIRRIIREATEYFDPDRRTTSVQPRIVNRNPRRQMKLMFTYGGLEDLALAARILDLDHLSRSDTEAMQNAMEDEVDRLPDAEFQDAYDEMVDEGILDPHPYAYEDPR